MTALSARTARVLLLAAAIMAAWPAAAADIPAFKARIDAIGAAARSSDRAIRDFYIARDYRPLWFEESGPAPRLMALIAALTQAREHGLNPARYGAARLAQQIAGADARARANFELIATRAFLDYAADLSSGAIDNPRAFTGVYRGAKRPDPKTLLEQLGPAEDTARFLDGLVPDGRRYAALRAALARYREIEQKGGWPMVGNGPTLKAGMKNARIAAVRRRLAVTGDYRPVEGDAELFDDALLAAVKAFQARHGLKPDGEIGPGTLGAMNVPAKDRVEQIAINLERRRWLAPYLGERYVYINIADNALKLVERGKTVHTARLVVGKPGEETETPVFSAAISYMELNPHWNVPLSIATKEMLPKIARDPSYLDANDYLVLTRFGDNTSAIDPQGVAWHAFSEDHFPLFIRQLPGPNNALGRMLFMFPNVHNVFVHDTPSRALFNSEQRYFSHGCMRVENPMKLALLLFGDPGNGGWTEQRITALLDKKEPARITLKTPVPVHITYLTAWADADGAVQFRPDIYKRDAELKRAVAHLAAMR